MPKGVYIVVVFLGKTQFVFFYYYSVWSQKLFCLILKLLFSEYNLIEVFEFGLSSNAYFKKAKES